jgi:peroxiredoxin
MTAPLPPGPHGPPPTRRRRALVIGAAVAGVAALAGGLVALPGGPARGPATLPDLAYPGIDGQRIGPDSLRGRVVLVNFWATSCAICVAEMPDLARLHEDLGPRGLTVLAIAMPYDRPDHVLHFAQTRRLPFAVALDPTGAAVAAWGGIPGTPASWLVGPDGRVLRHWLGRPDFVRLRREIEALLPPARPPAGRA